MDYLEWIRENADSNARVYLAYCEENGLRADLRWANLRGADLRWANLSGANMRWADLRWANMRWADLSGADLNGADLRWAVGPYTTFSAGKHSAVFCGGYGSIGCERRSYDEWLSDFAAIGRRNGYTDDEITDYGELIKFAVARQRRIEDAA